MNRSPWASGPAEILRHGLSLLKRDSDTNRRLAMLSIDNAVELMIKTYLGLPRRVTGIQMPRTAYQEIAESFPKLLDAIEIHASDKLTGISLAEIEWYHRLRNQLYHQGNGLTVERAKVEVYAELSRLLFANLFGAQIALADEPDHEPAEREGGLLGEYIALWAELEKHAFLVRDAKAPTRSAKRPRLVTQAYLIHILRDDGVVTASEALRLEQLRSVRNQIVHGAVEYKVAVSRDDLDYLRAIIKKAERALAHAQWVRDIPVPKTPPL